MPLRALVQAAKGEIPFTLAITNTQLVNVLTGEIYPVDVGIYGPQIASVRPAGEMKIRADQVIDAKGLYLSPGLIDTHVHIESSMLTPAHFAEAVIPHGTTAVVVDPHEIANVLGLEGVRYMLAQSRGLPLKVFVLAPSCVPSVPGLETSGASFGAAEIREMLSWDGVIGLAEVMDYPGVIGGGERMLSILQAARDANTLICGHCPQVRGAELQAYLAAGPDSDHEIFDAGEMLEKLRAGMTVEAHESFHSSNIAELVETLAQLPLLPPNVTFCIDDLPAQSLLELGHIDNCLRMAVRAGMDPVVALRIATIHGANRCRLHDLGVIAPGKTADLVLWRDLQDFRAEWVVCDGKVATRGGKMLQDIPIRSHPLEEKQTVRLLSRPTVADFLIETSQKEQQVNAIESLDGLATRFTVFNLPARKGTLDWQSDPDLCLAAVFERHAHTGHHSLGLIKGFGLKLGAIASTVSHDCHNLIVVGRKPEDMVLAANTLVNAGGGLVCAHENKVLGLVKLPVAGLLSLLPPGELAVELNQLKDAIRSLGLEGREPLLKIATLALPVIPDARLTDLGLVDVRSQQFVPFFVGWSSTLQSRWRQMRWRKWRSWGEDFYPMLSTVDGAL